MKFTKYLLFACVGLFVVLCSWNAWAQTPTPPADFLAQVLEAIKSFGGLSTLLKISAVITLIIASMKVTFLNELIWQKLGAAKVYLAPVLGLIAGILGIGTGGAPITIPLIFAYVSAGAGAVFLHEILDTIKALPGLGAIYITIIDLIEGVLGGPQDNAIKK